MNPGNIMNPATLPISVKNIIKLNKHERSVKSQQFLFRYNRSITVAKKTVMRLLIYTTPPTTKNRFTMMSLNGRKHTTEFSCAISIPAWES